MRRLALIVPMVLLPLGAAAQQDDRDYLTALLEDNLSTDDQKVTITGFKGALSSRATMETLAISDAEGAWLTLKDVVLDWNRAGLLTGTVDVNELSARDIVLERLPPSADTAGAPAAEATGFSLPELPVSVQIGAISAQRIALGAAILGTPVEGRIEASARLAGGSGAVQVMLERLDEGPDGTFDLQASYDGGSGDLDLRLEAREDAGGLVGTMLGIPGAPELDFTLAGAGPVTDFTANLALSSDGAERMAGTVRLQSETPGETDFALRIGGDLAPLFLPEYADFFGDLLRIEAAGARAVTGQVTLSQLAVQARGLQAQGSGSLAPDGLPERLNLDLTMGSPDGQPMLLPFATDARTALSSARLTLAYQSGQSDGWRLDGVVDGLSRNDLAAKRLSLTGSGRITRGTGNATRPVIGGTFRFATDGLAMADPALDALLGPALRGKATLYWQEGAEAVSIPQLELSAPGMEMAGGLRVQGLNSGISLSGRGTARIDDLARASLLAGRPLSGAAQLTAEGNGSVLGGGFDVIATIEGTDLALGVAEVDSLLRGASRVDLSVRRDETGTLLRGLDVAAASLKAKAQGRYASAGSDITADLDFGDLSALGGAYGGGLVAYARFTGTPEDGALTLTGTGRDLRIGQAQADALLRGETALTLEADLHGEAADLRRFDVTAPTTRLGLTGRLDPAGSDLNATLAMTELSRLGGGYQGAATLNAGLKGTVDNATVTFDGRAADLALGQAEVDRLLRGATEMSGALAIEGQRLRVDRFDLSNGQVVARASGAIDGATRLVALEATLRDLGIFLPEFSGQATVRGTAREDSAGYTLDLRATGPGGIDAAITGGLTPGFQARGLRIAGRSRAELANPFLRPRSIQGPVSFDVVMNGPFAPGSATGRVTLGGADVADSTLPFSLRGLNLNADLANGRAQLDGRMQISTGGEVAIGGSVGLLPPFDAGLEARLQGVVLRDPQLFETRLRGDVALRGPLTGGAVISGNVLLAETELRVPSTGLTGYGDLPGLEHVGERAGVQQTRRYAGLIAEAEDATGGPARPFGLDLTIAAPNRLFIRGRGLDAEMGGEMRIRGTTDAVSPSGAFELIRGRLDILGKRLTLSEATLRLEGDLVPMLRILASTESDGITASVQIEGPADEPKVSFVSAPSLPEEEVLARLLFNKGLTSLSALQAVQLASAVATLAGKGGEGIVAKLRKGIGLDDLDFDTDAEGNTSVRAGKYLSRNLYTEVDVNDKGQADINLNLDLTPNITVKGSAGTDGTSIGIFLEKDY